VLEKLSHTQSLKNFLLVIDVSNILKSHYKSALTERYLLRGQFHPAHDRSIEETTHMSSSENYE